MQQRQYRKTNGRAIRRVSARAARQMGHCSSGSPGASRYASTINVPRPANHVGCPWIDLRSSALRGGQIALRPLALLCCRHAHPCHKGAANRTSTAATAVQRNGVPTRAGILTDRARATDPFWPLDQCLHTGAPTRRGRPHGPGLLRDAATTARMSNLLKFTT